MEALTEPAPPYYLRGGELHPNGRWLIYAMNFDVAADREIEATWVYRHDLATGERRALARPAKATYAEPALNDQGTHILYSRQDLDPGGYQVWLVDIEGREDREILNFGPSAKVFASWFPDGRQVVFVAQAGSYRRVGVWDLASGETRWLIDDPGRNIEMAWAPRGTDRPTVVVEEIVATRVRCSLLNPATGEETAPADLPGNLVPLRPLPAGGWIGRYYSSTRPDDLVCFQPETGEPPSDGITGLWDHTALLPDDLAPAEEFNWHSDDGLAIQGWLYRPRSAAGNPSPAGTIVRVHGGPTAHSENSFDPQTQYFVSQGFTVLLPNYRGSTGFSVAFEESIKQDGWGGREQDDIRTGIEALIDASFAQPGKVGITGTSYGGYSSWCAITRFPTRILAAAAPICGMTDLVVDYETTRPDLRPYSEEMMGGRPDQAPERYRERSPINFVRNIRGRLLIVQGLRDPNVTPSNGQVVREALEEAGIPYEILTFPDEGHGIALRKNRRILYRRLVEFFTAAFA